MTKEQHLITIESLNKLGIFIDIESKNFYYLNNQQERITITAQEAKEFNKNFAILEKEAQKTSKGSSDGLLASMHIISSEKGGYLNKFQENIPPQRLLSQLNSLIETDKLLHGINASHTQNIINTTPKISQEHAKHLDNHDVKIEKIITQTTKFIAGIGGATASWESNDCCDINRLIINPEDQGYATLFEHGNLSAGVKNNGKALRGATFNLRINFR